MSGRRQFPQNPYTKNQTCLQKQGFQRERKEKTFPRFVPIHPLFPIHPGLRFIIKLIQAFRKSVGRYNKLRVHLQFIQLMLPYNKKKKLEKEYC